MPSICLPTLSPRAIHGFIVDFTRYAASAMRQPFAPLVSLIFVLIRFVATWYCASHERQRRAPRYAPAWRDEACRATLYDDADAPLLPQAMPQFDIDATAATPHAWPPR